jgi:hypothetical protein
VTRVRVRVLPWSLIVTVCLGLAGCQESPLEPPPHARGEPPPGPPPPIPGFPPVASPAGIYDRISASFIPGGSRYVLYDDTRFSLQYVRPDWGFFEYPGKYSRSGSLLTFDFDASNLAGAWLADGIVSGDSLIVKYNIVMQLADFEDGLYVRKSGGF